MKSITIDSIKSADTNSDVSDDCKSVIVGVIKEFKNAGHKFNFDEVRIVDISCKENGELDVMRTNAVDRYGYPRVILELNRRAFSQRSIEDMDNIFLGAKNTVCDSLKEAVVHEIGHAKTLEGRTYDNYERIAEELKSVHRSGVSDTALKDGLEFVAESEVLIYRGMKLSDEDMEFYNTYITGGG